LGGQFRGCIRRALCSARTAPHPISEVIACRRAWRCCGLRRFCRLRRRGGGWMARDDLHGDLVEAVVPVTDGPASSVVADGGGSNHVRGDVDVGAGGCGRDGYGGGGLHLLATGEGELDVFPVTCAVVVDAPGLDEGSAGIEPGAIGNGDVGDVGRGPGAVDGCWRGRGGWAGLSQARMCRSTSLGHRADKRSLRRCSRWPNCCRS
jgi:hypothetical protein